MIKLYKKNKSEYELGFVGALVSVFFYYFFRNILAPLIKRIWVKDVEGIECLPKKGPFIVASNHESYFDFICFWAVSPHQVRYLAAEKFYDSKFWKPIMIATGQIKVERKSKDKNKTHQEANLILKNKGVLGIFPEGTRSRTGEIGKAYHGVIKFSLEAKVPIVPVGMIGTYNILPPHKKLPSFKKCSIKISPPIHHHEHYDKEHTKELLRNLTDDLMLHIANLVDKEYRHHYSLENKEKIIEGKVVK